MLPNLFITRETKVQGQGSGRKLEQSKEQSPGVAALRNSTTLPAEPLVGCRNPFQPPCSAAAPGKQKKTPEPTRNWESKGFSRSAFPEFRDERHATFPSYLFGADSLVWGLCPFPGSVYSQASA